MVTKVSTRKRTDLPPTMDAQGSEGLSSSITPKLGQDADELTIVAALESYRLEADNNRKGGLNPRDEKWKENTDLYWNRYDFSKKQSWQAKEVMPEVPNYVDRFAAALKEALMSNPMGFYTVNDPADQENDIAQAVKKMTDMWLARSGRNQMGQVLDFTSVFEEQMKLGAIMATCSVTTWKGDVEHGRVAIETVDPRNVWLDHTNRNLYRLRRIELDRHDLVSMVNAKDDNNDPLFNIPTVTQLIASLNVDTQSEREGLTGHGQQVSSGRTPVVLDEYIATVVGPQGQLLADRALMVVANNKFLIRGPEANPFWHGNDWLLYAPLVTTPLSVYGRSYMEDFSSVAKTFTEMTNLILDAVHMTAMKAYAVVPGMLLNPEQVAEGITPHKLFLLEDGMRASDFAQALDLGTVSADAVRVWESMKAELGEAANINEIGLGQFAPNSRTSATEISETQQSSSALIRSIAQTVETRHLNPELNLVWKTGLQHADPKDTVMQSAVGKDMYQALLSKRKDLIQRRFSFQASGISSMIRRSAMLKALVGLMQIISQSDMLLQKFLEVVDMHKFTLKLFELSNIDITSLQATDREKMIQGVIQQMQQAQGGGGPAGAPPGGTGAANQMQDVASKMGVSK